MMSIGWCILPLLCVLYLNCGSPPMLTLDLFHCVQNLGSLIRDKITVLHTLKWQAYTPESEREEGKEGQREGGRERE